MLLHSIAWPKPLCGGAAGAVVYRYNCTLCALSTDITRCMSITTLHLYIFLCAIETITVCPLFQSYMKRKY